MQLTLGAGREETEVCQAMNGGGIESTSKTFDRMQQIVLFVLFFDSFLLQILFSNELM